MSNSAVSAQPRSLSPTVTTGSNTQEVGTTTAGEATATQISRSLPAQLNGLDLLAPEVMSNILRFLPPEDRDNFAGINDWTAANSLQDHIDRAQQLHARIERLNTSPNALQPQHVKACLDSCARMLQVPDVPQDQKSRTIDAAMTVLGRLAAQVQPSTLAPDLRHSILRLVLMLPDDDARLKPLLLLAVGGPSPDSAADATLQLAGYAQLVGEAAVTGLLKLEPTAAAELATLVASKLRHRASTPSVSNYMAGLAGASIDRIEDIRRDLATIKQEISTLDAADQALRHGGTLPAASLDLIRMGTRLVGRSLLPAGICDKVLEQVVRLLSALKSNVQPVDMERLLERTTAVVARIRKADDPRRLVLLQPFAARSGVEAASDPFGMLGPMRQAELLQDAVHECTQYGSKRESLAFAQQIAPRMQALAQTSGLSPQHRQRIDHCMKNIRANFDFRARRPD